MTMETTTQDMNEATVSFDNSNVYENVSADMNFDNLEQEHDGEQPKSAHEDDDWSSEEEIASDKKEAKKDKGEKLGSEELKLLNDTDGSEEKEKKEPKEEKEEEEEEN